MKAEIISIGSELTSGKHLDTNCQWLSVQLAGMGIAVGWHTTIADDFDANMEALAIACNRAGLVITTGGLGPTQDDLTREVLSKLAGKPLILHEESWSIIQQMFTRRQRVCPDRNKVQAFFPEGADPIPNETGTAPGVWMKVGNAFVVALPGVPREMKAMFLSWVEPQLRKLEIASGVLLQRKINTFGLGESAIEEQLFDLTQRGNDPEVGITASDAVISLRIMASGQDEVAVQEKILPIEQVIRARLGDLVFGVEDEELEDVVHLLLAKRGKTLATAESVTGGMLASKLTKVPGASAWFLGGMVTYANEIKTKYLGIGGELISGKVACSAELTLEMAKAVRLKSGADIGLATTGVAGPGDVSAELPQGKVFVALSSTWGDAQETNQWFGSRREVQSRTTKMALNLLRRHLLKGEGNV